MQQLRWTTALSTLAMALCAAPALAAFPDKPVTLIVPYAAGAGTDSAARTLATALQNHWKQTVVVTNIPGADGMIGSQHVLNAPADGYTVLFQIPQMLMWRWTMVGTGVEIQKNFRMLGKIQQTPLVVSVPAKLPAKDMAQLAAMCKTASPPCSIGTATTVGEFLGRQIMDAAGVGQDKVTFVPYKGGAPMMNDLLGGHVTVAMASSVGAMPQAKAGLVRMMAVTSPKRFSLLPEVPTLRELGYDVVMTTWYGLMAPKATPQAAVDALVAGIKAVSADQALLESIRKNGAEPLFGTPGDFEREVAAELTALKPMMEKFMNQR